MDLENVILSEGEGEILYDTPCMWNLKRNYTNELIYNAERDSQTWKTNLQLLEEGMGGRDRELGMDM